MNRKLRVALLKSGYEVETVLVAGHKNLLFQVLGVAVCAVGSLCSDLHVYLLEGILHPHANSPFCFTKSTFLNMPFY